MAYLMQYFYEQGPAPCEGSADCIQPTGNNYVKIDCPLTIESGDTDDSLAIEIYINNDVELSAFAIGLSYNSDDVEVTSIDMTGSVLPQPFNLFYKLLPDSNQLLLGYVPVDETLSIQSEGLIATLWIRIPAGISGQTINIDSTFVGPAGDFIFSPLSGGTIIPGYVDCGTEDITIVDYICGDVNDDGDVNIFDITFLIDYLYRGGPPPNHPNAADINNDGAVNIFDITGLIDYLYRDGPEPDCP